MTQNKKQTILVTEPQLNNSNNNTIDSDLDDLELDWLNEFQENTGIVSMRLGRFRPGVAATKQGFAPFLKSYSPDDPPTPDKVKAEFGGGEFQLVIYTNKPEGGRGIKKAAFSIEGDPIINGRPANTPVIAPQTNGNGLISSANGQESLIDTLIKLKQAGLIPDNKPADNNTALILEFMKQMHEQTLAQVNAKTGDTSKDVILETLLKSALEKNRGELADFEKYANIFSKFQGGTADKSELMELITAIAPPALQMLAASKQQAPGNVPQPVRYVPNPANRTAQAPQIAGNTGAQLQPVSDADIIAENERLKARLNGFDYAENFSVATLDEISERLIPEDENDSAEDPHEVYRDLKAKGDILHLEEFNWYLEKLQLNGIAEIENNNNNNLNNNTDMLGMFGFKGLEEFTTKLKNADHDERVSILKVASTLFDTDTMYKFCKKHDIVLDEKEFNQYMHAANIQPIPEPQELQ